MEPLQRYIAEEIATDHADGLLSRREALRRLGLMGLSATAAAALIAACGDRRPAQSDSSTTPASPPASPPAEPAPGMSTARSTEEVSWGGPQGRLLGSWAAAENPRAAVLVIHENKGLNDWVRSVAGRLAGVGYSALALDLLSSRGGTAQFDDPAEATAALAEITPERLLDEVNSALDELARRAPDQSLGVVGFCFGGGLVWRLLAAGAPRLAAAVPFYGPIPDDPDFSRSKDVAVLGFYGALDDRITSKEPEARAALDRAGLVYDLVVEPDADHAFFNDTGKRYDPVAAADAWRRLQDWFARHLS